MATGGVDGGASCATGAVVRGVPRPVLRVTAALTGAGEPIVCETGVGER
jgi:hypothetical protein